MAPQPPSPRLAKALKYGVPSVTPLTASNLGRVKDAYTRSRVTKWQQTHAVKTVTNIRLLVKKPKKMIITFNNSPWRKAEINQVETHPLVKLVFKARSS